MKKEYIRNGIITSVIGVGLLLTLPLSEKGEEVSKESDSYDYKSKYDFKEMTTIDSIVNSNELVHKAEEIRLAKEKVRKLAEAERIEKARIQKVKAEKERLAKIEQDRIEKEKVKQAKLAEQKQSQPVKQKEDISNWMTFEASYYTAKCYKCSGVSKSGVDLRKSIFHQGMRVVASDNNVIPLWSIIEISTHYGNFKAIVLDSGGRIKGSKLDVLVGSTKEALNLGRHNVKVKIIRKGKG